MTDYDVRCTKLHARIVRTSPRYVDPLPMVLEVKCDSRICRGPYANVVVLHYFSLSDGKLLETKRFRNPPVAIAGEKVNT